MRISDEVLLELPASMLINFTGFIIYLCLPSRYCQVVASRTYVATAVPNEIKDIDSKDPTSRLVAFIMIVIVCTTFVKWHDSTKQIDQLISSSLL